MSMILAIGNESQIVGFSDGRVSGTGATGNHIVLRENQCKIETLSDKAIILFTGELSQCMPLVRYLKDFPVGDKTATQYSRIIMQTEIIPDKAVQNINVRLIVAGIGEDGKREWWSHKINSAGDRCRQTKMADYMQYLALGDIELDEENYIEKILNQKSAIDEQVIRDCFEAAAKRHNSINTTLFRRMI